MGLNYIQNYSQESYKQIGWNDGTAQILRSRMSS